MNTAPSLFRSVLAGAFLLAPAAAFAGDCSKTSEFKGGDATFRIELENDKSNQSRLFYRICENCSLQYVEAGGSETLFRAAAIPEGSTGFPITLVPGSAIRDAGGIGNLTDSQIDKIVKQSGFDVVVTLEKEKRDNGKWRSRFVSFDSPYMGVVECDRSWRDGNTRWRIDLSY